MKVSDGVSLRARGARALPEKQGLQRSWGKSRLSTLFRETPVTAGGIKMVLRHQSKVIVIYGS
jgi:hypothetical protein